MPYQVKRWESIRTEGRQEYTLWRGVIGWGVPFLLLFGLLRVVLPWMIQSPEHRQSDSICLIAGIPLLAILSLVGGWVVGTVAWASGETEYRKHVQQSRKADEAGENVTLQ